MKYPNKLASAFLFAALGIMTLTGCEGGDLYNIDVPAWLSEMGGGEEPEPEPEEELVGQMEDVYDIGNAELTAAFFTLGKTYIVPAGEKWQAQFNLTVNPDNKYYKNFYLVINAVDAETGGAGAEYGVIRYDNDPNKNSEWNTESVVNPNLTEINRDLVGGNFTNSSPTEGDNLDVDASVQKMNGKITLTVDRAEGGLYIKMTNGTLTKTYTQTTAFPSTGADVPLAFRIGVEQSLVSFISTNIEPIGGCTSADDKQPVSMELMGVPSEVLVGTPLDEAMANVSATVTFEEGVVKTVTAEELQFQTIPDYGEVGQYTLVVLYNKTFKGQNADKTAMAAKTFKVVKELSAFTQTVVVPTPLLLGAEDNSTAFWGAHTDNIKIAPKETKVTTFTNYSSCVANWNNFCIVLCKADNSEYAVVRADNYGWGDCYASCTPIMEDGRDWDVWRPAMDGAKVTTYVTNNGDGTLDVKAVMVGNDGITYTQQYKGMKGIDADNLYFRFTVDGCHLVFDNTVGATDNSTGFWNAHSPNIQVIGHQVCTVNFTNYSSCVANWNNFVIVLCSADGSKEYAVVRADNYGWGDGYAACTPAMEDGRNWDEWRPAMDGAKCTAKISNNGDGTADIAVEMIGNNGKTYTQSYTGINTVDPDNFYFNFTVDGSHLVFE